MAGLHQWLDSTFKKNLAGYQKIEPNITLLNNTFRPLIHGQWEKDFFLKVLNFNLKSIYFCIKYK